ncbi:hypothetical protein [Marinicella sp. W31]|uniref:LpxL/LpxP family acyltransferase n=1 Tax=Marinicella sp. W31 TaxID=3023713 RepID=UPI00375676B2
MSQVRPSLIKYFPAWCFYGLCWLLAQLPLRLNWLLGAALGTLVRWFGIRRRVIDKNIAKCFPSLDSDQQQALIKANYRETGIMATQTLKTFLGMSERLYESLPIEGTEHLEACLQNKQGVLLVSAHFTALDVGGKVICKRYPVAGVYRPHKNPVMEYVVNRARLRYAKKMFARDELRGIVRHLKSAGIVWYAPDQDYRRGSSIFSPFFDIPASTITATHQLARMTGCAVLFFSVERIKKKPYYALKLSPPVAPFPTEVQADTDRINTGVQAMVEAAPSQYLWLHKRFKTQPEGTEDFYAD